MQSLRLYPAAINLPLAIATDPAGATISALRAAGILRASSCKPSLPDHIDPRNLPNRRKPFIVRIDGPGRLSNLRLRDSGQRNPVTGETILHITD